MLFKIANVITMISAFLPKYEGNEVEYTNNIVVGTIILILYILATFLMIFRTGWIIDTLHLNKDFTQEDIDINFNPEIVYRIALIVIGSISIWESFTKLCFDLITILQNVDFLDSKETIFNALHFLFGGIIIFKNESIAKFLFDKAKK
ncbi:hypothetical protein [Emticicia oligotrophica]|uniref:hypothetical protein n=1 Tax=Emticicia oligotrophica TaxID=312279 RepID=UPI00273C6903|nr:hypothetical protein [Emticicia oligotrophica]